MLLTLSLIPHGDGISSCPLAPCRCCGMRPSTQSKSMQLLKESFKTPFSSRTKNHSPFPQDGISSKLLWGGHSLLELPTSCSGSSSDAAFEFFGHTGAGFKLYSCLGATHASGSKPDEVTGPAAGVPGVCALSGMFVSSGHPTVVPNCITHTIAIWWAQWI